MPTRKKPSKKKSEKSDKEWVKKLLKDAPKESLTGFPNVSGPVSGFPQVKTGKVHTKKKRKKSKPTSSKKPRRDK